MTAKYLPIFYVNSHRKLLVFIIKISGMERINPSAFLILEVQTFNFFSFSPLPPPYLYVPETFIKVWEYYSLSTFQKAFFVVNLIPG